MDLEWLSQHCVTCECWFISCNKCTALEGDVVNGGGFACEGAGVCRNTVPFSEFCYEPKTTPQKSPKK